jgi:hypothetical protein
MLHLRTFGAVALFRPVHGEPKSVAVQPKRLALLINLARSEPVAFLRRDSLLALFWPESTTERARSALRQALTGLRRVVGEDVLITRGEEESRSHPTRLPAMRTNSNRPAREVMELPRYLSTAATFWKAFTSTAVPPASMSGSARSARACVRWRVRRPGSLPMPWSAWIRVQPSSMRAAR